jgi:hypothetical protein
MISLLLLLLLLGLAAARSRADGGYSTANPDGCADALESRVFQVATLEFTAAALPADPFALSAGLEARFTTVGNGSAGAAPTSRTVRGFWDGGRVWRVRFAAPQPGCWRWTTSCLPLSAGDSGLCHRAGALHVLPAADTERRRLFRHGGFLHASPVHAPGRPHLQYTDGAPFWWLADTLWTAPSSAVSLATFTTATALRARQGFTAIQIHGSEGFGGPNVTAAIGQRNVSVFQQMEGYFEAAAQQDLLLVVGFSRGDLLTRFPGSEFILPKLFSYHMARFGAFPISYLGTQEYNCFTYSSKPNVSELLAQGAGLAAADPYSRALTMHPAVLRLDTHDAWRSSWYGYAMLQQGHLVNNTGVLLTRLRAAVRESTSRSMPVVNGEANYEGFVRGWPLNGSSGTAEGNMWNWTQHSRLNCFEYVNAACVRDTLYTSLQLGLSGFTYGAQGTYAGVPDLSHPGPTSHHGPVLTTEQGLQLEGAGQLIHAETFYSRIVGVGTYNLLMPCDSCLIGNGATCCPRALATRPSDTAAASFAIYIRSRGPPPVARGQLDRDEPPLALNVSHTRDVGAWSGVLFNPRNGISSSFSATSAGGVLRLPAVGDCNDWLLWVQPARPSDRE